MRDLGNVWIFVKMDRIVYIYSGLVAEQINDWTLEQLKGRAFKTIFIGGNKWQKQTGLKLVLRSDSNL